MSWEAIDKGRSDYFQAVIDCSRESIAFARTRLMLASNARTCAS